MLPTNKYHPQQNLLLQHSSWTSFCLPESVGRKTVSSANKDILNCVLLGQNEPTIESQNCLYLVLSPSGHSLAAQVALNISRGATGSAVASFGFGKNMPQRKENLWKQTQVWLLFCKVQTCDLDQRACSHSEAVPVLSCLALEHQQQQETLGSLAATFLGRRD